MLTVRELVAKLAGRHPDEPVVLGYVESDGDQMAASLESIVGMTDEQVNDRFGLELSEPGPVCCLLTISTKKPPTTARRTT
jgi:hypothetical protein